MKYLHKYLSHHRQRPKLDNLIEEVHNFPNTATIIQGQAHVRIKMIITCHNYRCNLDVSLIYYFMGHYSVTTDNNKFELGASIAHKLHAT